VDDQKCAEIKRLKQEFEKMKRHKENSLGDVPIYECGRLPVNHASQKSMIKIEPKERAVLASLSVEPNLKESILISSAHKQEKT
jgi:hypothetical protein